MYPLQCYAGYFVPIKEGRLEIIGVQTVVSTTSSASRIVFTDDKDIKDRDKFGKIKPSNYDKQKGIIDVKGIANIDAILEQFFPNPLKTRFGLSAVETTNIVPGTIKVYVK